MADGIFARVPLDEVTLGEAAELVDDPSFWHATRIPVLFHFPQVAVDDYWELPVGTHREMVEFLVGAGLMPDGG